MKTYSIREPVPQTTCVSKLVGSFFWVYFTLLTYIRMCIFCVYIYIYTQTQTNKKGLIKTQKWMVLTNKSRLDNSIFIAAFDSLVVLPKSLSTEICDEDCFKWTSKLYNNNKNKNNNIRNRFSRSKNHEIPLSDQIYFHRPVTTAPENIEKILLFDEIKSLFIREKKTNPTTITHWNWSSLYIVG